MSKIVQLDSYIYIEPKHIVTIPIFFNFMSKIVQNVYNRGDITSYTYTEVKNMETVFICVYSNAYFLSMGEIVHKKMEIVYPYCIHTN